MAKPKKKEINFTKDSILTLMQEIYNELVEQRSTAIRIQNKMISMMQQPEDMTFIGPVIEKQQKIINDCVEKKLTLSKLQSGIWEKQNSKEESFDISNMDEEVDTNNNNIRNINNITNNGDNIVIDILPLTQDNLNIHENVMLGQPQQMPSPSNDYETTLTLPVSASASTAVNASEAMPSFVLDDIDPDGMM